MALSVFNIIYVINSEDSILRNPATEHVNPHKFIVNTPSTGAPPSGVLTAKGTLDSLTEGHWNHRLAVKVSIYDICCTATTRSFADTFLTKAPSEVEYFERVGATVCQCFNEGLDRCTDADWVNLTKSSSCYDGNVLLNVLDVSEEYHVSVVSMKPVQYMNGKSSKQLYYSKKLPLIELENDPFHTNMCLDSLFIKQNVVKGLRFDNNIPFEPTEFFLIRLYEQAMHYAVSDSVCRIGEYLATDAYNYEPEFEKDWYTDIVRNVYIPFLMKEPDSVIRQAALVRLVELKFWANGNERNKAILTKEEQEEFFKAVAEMFQHIDDDVLSQHKWSHKRVLQKFMGMNFLRMKYGDYSMQGTLEKTDEDILVVCGKNRTAVMRFQSIPFNIMAINFEDGALKIDGEVANTFFADHDKINFYAICGDTVIPAERNNIYSYAKYFGLSVKKGYMVQIRIPKEMLKDKLRIHFIAEFQGEKVACPCSFKKIQTRLFGKYKNSYWKFSNYLLKYDKKETCLYLQRATVWNHLSSELKFMWNIRKDPRGIALRFLYYLTIPIYGRKNIWITFDQLFKGGDNGEYFYRYVNEHHRDDVDMYYIANPTSKEYGILQEKYGRVLRYRSLKLLLISLHAKMIFATRVDVRLYCGYSGFAESCIRDLFNAEIVCLQHGLTIQKIAQYQNRLFDNLKYYFCVSPYEVDNIMNPLYGYTSDMLKLTGAPRYDGLTGTPKRQILITPTWRRNVTAGTNTKGSNHEYSVNFKHTVYYNIYNTLINDERLIACAKKTNYKLIYLIHPILSPQADDFERNEFVEIVPGVDVNYEKILKESSLMVTDYSGIQFDFAYMRRPLVYYHPQQLPPQYDAGNLDYATMGFGPVCKTNDEVVEALCHLMEQDCALDEMYRQRIEDFFPFNDQNNCKRVYEAAIAYQESHNRQ